MRQRYALLVTILTGVLILAMVLAFAIMQSA